MFISSKLMTIHHSFIYVLLTSKISFGTNCLHTILLAERHPHLSKLQSFTHGFQSHRTTTIIRKINRKLLCRIVQSHGGYDRVHNPEWRFCPWISCAYEDVYGWKLVVFWQPLWEDGSGDRSPIERLIEEP
ncbi:hypothetical protein HanIR_Chr03g0147701 [Helianthus annuus]|nr:hypothetical protein HanIR_Chr03g0147701 [Helianthus annuus]